METTEMYLTQSDEIAARTIGDDTVIMSAVNPTFSC